LATDLLAYSAGNHRLNPEILPMLLPTLVLAMAASPTGKRLLLALRRR